MPIIEVQQQTDEWVKMRIGCLTASRMIDVVTRLQKKTKNGEKGAYSQKRENYLWEIVSERLTGRAADHYVSPYMDYGSQQEPFAKAAYELEYDVEIQPGCFALHPKIQWFGASVDALIGDDGCAEFKCLQAKNHIQIVDTDTIPEEFLPQMLAEMACYDRQWCDFASYCGEGEMPPDLRLFRKRLFRDEALIEMVEKEAETFLEDVVLKLGDLAKRAAERKSVDPMGTRSGIIVPAGCIAPE